jgi:Sec-independent protein translocase protein TatA
MIELAVTILVVLFVLGAMQIPSLGDALGRFFRGPPREPGDGRTRPDRR